jgi:type II secretory pathway component GspD/PulD (secretin)
MSPRQAVCAACCAALLLAAALPAQDKPAKVDASKSKWFYVVKYGSARDLASLLSKHFKGDLEVSGPPEAPADCLLLSGSPAALDEAGRVLDQLDRRPARVAVEVLIAETAPTKDKDRDLDDKDFTGPAADVLAKLEALQKKGQIGQLRRIQLSTLENQAAEAVFGESRPFVMGTTTRGPGTVSRSITYRHVGVSVKLTPRVSVEHTGPGKTPTTRILLDLHLEDAQARIPEDAPEIGKDEDGKAIRAAVYPTDTLTARLSVASGQAIPARVVRNSSKTGQDAALVIVSARLLDGDANDGKK